MFAYIDADKRLQIVATNDNESNELLEWWARHFTLKDKIRKNLIPRFQITYYEQ